MSALVRRELALVLVGDHFEFFQLTSFEKILRSRRRATRNMVGNAIDPGPQRTPGVVPLKTPPQLKMKVLAQVAALFRVSLVCPREPFQSGTELGRRIPVQAGLARLSVQESDPPQPR